MKRGGLAALCLLVGACAHHREPPAPIPVEVLCTPVGAGLRIGGTELAELQSAEAKTILAQLVPDRGRTLVIANEVPYDCAAQAIRALSRLGYRHIRSFGDLAPPGP